VADGELTDLQALTMVVTLISAGGESTTSLTGAAVRILAENPALQSELRADLSLVPRFIEEALRWDPPFRGHYRSVTRDSDLGGTALPAGSHLVLMWPAANRDEATYGQPDEIRLDRANPRRHVGFGWGPHLCVGAPLARIEAKVALETLLTMSSDFRIDEEAPPPRYHSSLMVRRLESLPLVVAQAR
jgi:cytochrome P450